MSVELVGKCEQCGKPIVMYVFTAGLKPSIIPTCKCNDDFMRGFHDVLREKREPKK